MSFGKTSITIDGLFCVSMFDENEPHARITKQEFKRLGELTKREIQVWGFLKMCKNAKTGQCNPSRSTIAAGTGLKLPHVSIAIPGLEAKGWIVDLKGGGFFVVPIRRVPKVTELVTSPEAPEVTDLDQKVTESVSQVTNSVILLKRNSFEQTKNSKREHKEKIYKKEIWEKAKESLRLNLNKDIYSHHFEALEFTGISESGFHIKAHPLSADWINRLYSEQLENAIITATGLDNLIVIWETIDDAAADDGPPPDIYDQFNAIADDKRTGNARL